MELEMRTRGTWACERFGVETCLLRKVLPLLQDSTVLSPTLALPGLRRRVIYLVGNLNTAKETRNTPAYTQNKKKAQNKCISLFYVAPCLLLPAQERVIEDFRALKTAHPEHYPKPCERVSV